MLFFSRQLRLIINSGWVDFSAAEIRIFMAAGRAKVSSWVLRKPDTLLAAIKTSAGRRTDGQTDRQEIEENAVRTHGEQSFSMVFGIFVATNSVTHAQNYATSLATWLMTGSRNDGCVVCVSLQLLAGGITTTTPRLRTVPLRCNWFILYVCVYLSVRGAVKTSACIAHKPHAQLLQMLWSLCTLPLSQSLPAYNTHPLELLAFDINQSCWSRTSAHSTHGQHNAHLIGRCCPLCSVLSTLSSGLARSLALPLASDNSRKCFGCGRCLSFVSVSV